MQAVLRKRVHPPRCQDCAPAAEGVHTPRRGRILVIDDEPAVGRTLQPLLGSTHDVTVLSEGQEAVHLLTRDGDFDLVFCDLTMPELSGMDVFERCRESRPELAPRFVS